MTSRAEVPERSVLAEVRRRRRGHDPRSVTDRFTDLYMGLFIALYVVATVVWLLGAELPAGDFDLGDALVWLPLLVFGVMWGILHHATWQGPVLFSSPDMQWVLAAPLKRRGLVLMKMRRAFFLATAAGVVGGFMVAVIASATTDGGFWSAWGAAAPALAAAGVMAVALSWHVERSVQWGTVLVRATPIVIVFGGLVAYAVATGREDLVLWSGPWGWAVAPLFAVSVGSFPGWLFGLVLLGLATLAATALAVGTAAEFSEEELWRRAEARSAAAAALFFGDIRTVRSVARRSRTRGVVRGREVGLVRFSRPTFAIVSRDLQALRRNPGRVAVAAMATGAAFAAAITATRRPVFAVLAFVALYVAGSRLLEPIRVEVEQPDAHLLLPWRWGSVLVMHCIVPAVVLAVLGWLGLAVVGAAGLVDAGAIPPLVLVTPFAAAAIVTAGAISASREPFPVDMMISGADSGAFLLVLWLVAGPVLAGLVVSFAFGGMIDGLDRGITGSTVWAAIILSAGTSAFTAWLSSRKAPT